MSYYQALAGMMIIISSCGSTQFTSVESNFTSKASPVAMEGNLNNWRMKLLDFPRPALYDEGLSGSLQVSVHVSQGNNTSNATFNFVPPTSIPCSNLAYLLILTSPNYSTPRLEGPFRSSQCSGRLKIPVYHITTDASYSAYIVAYNGSLSFKSTSLHFTTTDVAWATVIQGSKHMKFTCHFTEASRAKGCLIQINSFPAGSKETLRVTRITHSHLASRCWEVPPGTIPQVVEVRDWKADGSAGSLAVTTYTEENLWSPCYEDLETRWQHAAHLVLFSMAATFMGVGILLQCSGLLCRIAGINRYLRRREGTELDKESYAGHAEYKSDWVTEKVNTKIQIDNTG